MIKKRKITGFRLRWKLSRRGFLISRSNSRSLTTDLGFTAADVTSVNNDSLVVNWLADADEAFEANSEGFRKFRDETLYSEKGDSAPTTSGDGFARSARDSDDGDHRTARQSRRAHSNWRTNTYRRDRRAKLVMHSDDEARTDRAGKLETGDQSQSFAGRQVENSFVRGESDGILYETQIGAETVWTEKADIFQMPPDHDHDRRRPAANRPPARPLPIWTRAGRSVFRHRSDRFHALAIISRIRRGEYGFVFDDKLKKVLFDFE